MLTLPELKERLAKQVDEISLLELLSVTSEDLVEAFEDRIEAKYPSLSREFEEDDSNSSN